MVATRRGADLPARLGGTTVFGLLLVLGSLALVACSDTASIRVNAEGVVTDPLGRAVANATVTIPTKLAGEKPLVVTTDATGYFTGRFDGFGSFEVIVTAEGYARYVDSFTVPDVPDVAGDFVSNAAVNPVLYELTGSLRGRISQSQGDRAPVAGAALLLRFDDDTIKDPNIVLTTITDEQGEFEFTGLPSGAGVTLFVNAVDVDGDGSLDTAATSVGTTLNFGTPTTLNRSVGRFDGNPAVVWTNISGNNLVATDSAIEVYFNSAMDSAAGRTNITLTRQGQASQVVAFTTAWSDGKRFLTITPVSPFTAGESYNLSIEAFTQLEGLRVAANYDFDVRSEAPPSAPQGLALDRSILSEVPSNVSNVPLVWNAVEGVDAYAIYAKKPGGGIPDWVRLSTVSVGSLTIFYPKVQATATLSDEFRPDGFTFASGETISLAVSALRDDEESPLSSSITIGDEECPSGGSLTLSPTGTGSWNNTGSEPLSVYVQVQLSEPVPLNSQIDLTFNSVLDGSTFEPAWVNHRTVRLVGEVPAHTDASSLDISIDLSSVRDPSGNSVCGGDETLSGSTPAAGP